MTQRRYGIVLGRLQPLHVGHMEYLTAAYRLCERLIVGITNPDTSALTFHEADPKRSMRDSNPYSFFSRYEMIDAALRGVGWSAESYGIVPVDLDHEARLGVFLPPRDESTVFITIYDAWGEEKANRLRTLNYNVEVLWRREMSERVTSGTEIRARMLRGDPWQHLVPEPVARYLESAGLPVDVNLEGSRDG